MLRKKSTKAAFFTGLFFAVSLIATPGFSQDAGINEDEDEDNEVEFFGAAITATTCAKRVQETGDIAHLTNCPPWEAFKNGYAAYDLAEQEAYVLSTKNIYLYELERGFGGNIDLEGIVVGEQGGVSLVEPEEYTINPRPKPGAFKGCL